MLPNESPFLNATKLKDLPYTVDGSFGWLANTPRHREWTIGERGGEQLLSQLASVVASAKKRGIALPEDFVRFIGTPALHSQIRSVGACYLEVAQSVLPFAKGYLTRFLADQQGSAFWYLYACQGKSDHCVVSSYEYFDADDMGDEIDEPRETDFQFCAESFEAFLLRFWLENEILFAKYESTPPPHVDPRFLELYSQ